MNDIVGYSGFLGRCNYGYPAAATKFTISRLLSMDSRWKDIEHIFGICALVK